MEVKKRERSKGKRILERAENISNFWAYKESDNLDKESLILLDNVQFIYELALAQLELRALGVDFKLTNGLREFKLIKAGDIEEVLKRAAYFKVINGRYTDYFRIIQKNVTRSVNQYLTHWIYPYKGKFHPQMIRALLNIIGVGENDVVLDPFIGSGTTAIEAQLLGINCIGIDVSPLCVLQSKVKTESVNVIDEILAVKNDIMAKIKPNLFNQENESFLTVVDFVTDERVKNFYKMAYLVAVSDNARRKRDLYQSFYKNVELMITSVEMVRDIAKELGLRLGTVDIKTGDARKLPLEDESIDGIITSPPYSIALDYVSNDAHALKVLGYELPKIREEFIGVRGKGSERIDLYNQDMMESYREMYRVLKPGKFAVIIIGNATYSGEEVKTVEFTINYCEKLGFKLVKNIDKIIFGLYNVMQKENILIFHKT
jgi:ubiquinone/menaquinone biosynthesis C-methylase UbiE